MPAPRQGGALADLRRELMEVSESVARHMLHLSKHTSDDDILQQILHPTDTTENHGFVTYIKKN